ncbi:MAG: zf-HC2 domain-containing protein [Spirochaetia bacterium]|nr:zf-HC2 domain-containing protein [Spirochaetia bacterium]
MKKCAEFEELISLYYTGMLSNQERSLVDSHVSVCGRCATELKKTGMLMKISDDNRAPEMSEEYWDKYGVKLSEKIGKINRKPHDDMHVFEITAAAAAVFLVASVLFVIPYTKKGKGVETAIKPAASPAALRLYNTDNEEEKITIAAVAVETFDSASVEETETVHEDIMIYEDIMIEEAAVLAELGEDTSDITNSAPDSAVPEKTGV